MSAYQPTTRQRYMRQLVPTPPARSRPIPQSEQARSTRLAGRGTWFRQPARLRSGLAITFDADRSTVSGRAVAVFVRRRGFRLQPGDDL